MQLTGREASPTNMRENVIFNSLSLDGTSGKVRATVDERMLCIESKTGHALDIRINSISRVHHHHTKLIPFGFALIGFGLVWIGTRILSHQTFKIISVTLGASLILGWLLTRKPTITIDTEAGDCHALTGNDAALLRLNTILLRLQQGFTISEAQEGLEILDRDSAYPRSSLLEKETVPVAAVEIQAPESIATFLEAELGDFMFSTEQTPSEPIIPTSVPVEQSFEPNQAEVPALPSWLDNPRPVNQNISSDKLIQRGIENVRDRRNHQEPHPMSMFNQIEQPKTIEHRAEPLTYVPPNSLPSESSYIQNGEAGRSVLPEPLPNFFSKEGYHAPQQDVFTQQPTTEYDVFTSPDSILGHVDEFGEEIESLVANARRNTDTTALSNNDAVQNKDSIQQKFPRLRSKNSQINSRLKPKKRVENNETGSLFRNIMIPAANRVANSVKEATSNISNKLLSGKGVQETSSSAEELRSRSSEAHEREVEELYRNLAVSNGGSLPDEKVREMKEIALRRKAISEQVEQEKVEIFDDIGFGDLIDSDSNNTSAKGKEGLQRIDS
ncbi:MAG: hypothetical protein DWB99_06180 [Candidatus Poseidoniales archaeon]|nr:MAG: hypothetical protein DWB99_06180 [Candidatus Poseidoniales archaeon]|tara:strand:- start:7089 stop:8756 length:1668 start_codon:yes stop_codon:yes gene_type:complete